MTFIPSKIWNFNVKDAKLKEWILPLLALLGVGGALICVLTRPKTIAPPPVVIPPSSPFQKTIAGIGIVEPKSEIITIGVPLPGIVTEVCVKWGDPVKKNDILFKLDQREIDAQIRVLEKNLASCKISAEDAAAQFKIVSHMKDGRSLSKDDFNKRSYAKKLAFSKVEEIKAQLAMAHTTKDRLTITAPIDGKILDINIRPGEYAATDKNAAPLVRMGDVSTLHVRVEFDEEYTCKLKTSHTATAIGIKRGDTLTHYPLEYVRVEQYVKPKQNLVVSGQRVDTRVLQVIYALPVSAVSLFVGQQMDVFIEESKSTKD